MIQNRKYPPTFTENQEICHLHEKRSFLLREERLKCVVVHMYFIDLRSLVQ
jgi:hypothetical protein